MNMTVIHKCLRHFGAVAAALALLSFAAQALAADAKAEITNFERKCIAATTADQMMDCFDDSDELVLYDIGTPREFDGPKAVRADFQNVFDNYKNMKIEFVSLHVVTDGKMGLANGIEHMTATDKNGKPVDMTFRATDVLRKKEGKWKIIHSHVSFPTDLATGKADLQSKP